VRGNPVQFTEENDELALYEGLRSIAIMFPRVSCRIERATQRRREGEKVSEQVKSLVRSRYGKFAETGGRKEAC